MAERKFTNVRKRLDQLGYRQPLGIESVPLVEKLFSDLIHTTESLKNAKLELKGYTKGKVLAEDNVEPYRNDNAKLVRENNELHLQLIKTKEEGDARVREFKTKCSRLESENADLKFLNSQYIHRVKSLEKESSSKSDKIQLLQEENMNAVIETPGGRKKKIPHRRQRMDIESVVEPSKRTANDTNTIHGSDPYFTDLMEVADKRISDLQEIVDRLQYDAEAAERRNKSLKKQIDSRDTEIERLNNLLEGGRPVDAILTDNKRESSDRVIAHLNIQVDYLQQVNRDLERKVRDLATSQQSAKEKALELQEKNDELCAELHDLGKATQATKTETSGQISQLRKNIEQMENELDSKQTLVLEVQEECHKLRKERDLIVHENENLNVTITDLRNDLNNFSELLDNCEKEKRRLQELNSKLTFAEKELTLKLEKSSRRDPKPSPSKSPDRIRTLMKSLESERDHFKAECQSLRSLIKKKIIGGESSKASSSTHATKDQSHMEGLCQMLEEERDFYRREYEMMRNIANSQRHLGSPPTKDNSYQSPTEKSRLRRERDELQTMLASFERQLTEIKLDVKSANDEKGNMQLLYEQATDEIHRLRRQLSRTRSTSPSRKVTSILDRVEKERDDAIDDLRRLRNELHNLEGQIKVLSDSQAHERTRYDNKIADLEAIVGKLEDERRSLQTRLSTFRDMKDNLEGQLKATMLSVRTTRETVADKEAEISKFKLLLEQNERTTSDLKTRLQGKIKEMQSREDDKLTAEGECGKLKHKNRLLDKEVDRLQGVVRSVDANRDRLQQEIDEHTEKLASAKERMKRKEKHEQDLKSKVSSLTESVESKETDLSQKSREIKILSTQVTNLESEVANVARTREATVRENRRLQEDLQMMTQENQNVNQRLQEAVDEQEILKLQVSDYANQVARVEELLSHKDQEKQDLIVQFNSLTNKAELLESNVQQSLGEASVYKNNLLSREQELDQLAGRCTTLESEIEHYISANDAYEQHLASLTSDLDFMKEQMQNKDREKDELMQDLNAVRDLCMKLDKTREDLTKQLANHSVDQDKLHIMLQESKDETDNLKRQVFKERDTVSSLESILSANREKQFYESRSHEETYIELQKLQGDSTKLERQRDMKDSEVRTLRKSIETLQDELSHLRRQLTAEKYEKERLTQELRRYQPTPTDHLSADSFRHTRASGSDSTSLSDKLTTAPLSPVRPSSSVLSQLRDQTEGYSTDNSAGSRP